MRKVMLAIAACAGALAVAGLPKGAAAAVGDQDFVVRTTHGLVELCSAGKDDPRYGAAVHFCQGYLVGAFQYREAEHAGSKTQMTCLPDPAPSRDQAVQMFVSWAQAHPEFSGERPADSFGRFLDATFPCRK